MGVPLAESGGWCFQLYVFVHLLRKESSAWPTPNQKKIDIY